MEYKHISIEDVEEILGFGIREKSNDEVVTRARHGAWLCFFINGYTYADIGRMFDITGRAVLAGVDRFEDLLKERDALTVELWEKLKVYEL